MKLAVLSGDYPKVISGVGDNSYYLIRELQKSGVETVLVTTDVPEIPDPGFPTLKIRWRLRDYAKLRAFLKRQQVTHVMIQYPCSLYGKYNLIPHLYVKWLRLAGYKIVATLHEFSNIHLLRRLSEYVFLFFSHWIFVTNEYERRAVSAFFPRLGKKVSIVPAGNNVSVERSPADADPGVIAFFGIFYPNKQMEQVIRMMAEIERQFPRKYTFRFIGGVHPYYREYYQAFREQAESALPRSEWRIDRPIEEIGGLIKDVFCAALYFKDGVSSRRSSFTAFISNGIPVITNPGRYSGELNALEGKGLFYAGEAFQNIPGVLQKLHAPQFYETCHQTLVQFARPFQYPAIAAEYRAVFARL